MNDSRYKWILYVIIFVILGTIGIQVFWNYKNYLINKQQFINEVQISLDNSVETYFADLAQENTLRFAFRRESEEDSLFNNSIDSILHRFEFTKKDHKKPDSVNIELVDRVAAFHGIKGDSVFQRVLKNDTVASQLPSKLLLKTFTTDSLNSDNFKNLTSRVIVSLTNDSLDLEKIDTLLHVELKRKNLNLNYGLSYSNQGNKIQYTNESGIEGTTLTTISKSTYLPQGSALKIHFLNESSIILKRIVFGMIISTLLVLIVISCLFYLLKIIKHQKQLAEVKNDLISNITHEFKTPIATIGVALESIKDFKIIDDKEKTKQYLKMSGDQLSKLNIMVEKLLETATLDSDSLQLQKENFDVIKLLSDLVEKHSIQIQDKSITLIALQSHINLKLDMFHFENAINNIIDNAIKYGGDVINVKIDQLSNGVEISISDNGNILTKAHKDKIFEQFYRIPKGNTHNVKGFGIGLYYTKKIIEKHGGTIQLELSPNQSTFKIILPNA